MLADAYSKMGKIDKAIEVLERFRETSENSIIALYELAELYKRIGNEEKAREYESLIMEIDPRSDPNGIEIWAKVHLKKGNYEKVIQMIEKRCEELPRSKTFKLGFGSCVCKDQSV